MGPYYLTQLVILLGPIAMATATMSHLQPRRVVGVGPRAGREFTATAPTHVEAAVTTVSGVPIALTASWSIHATGRPHLELYGTRGTLALPDPNFHTGPVRIARTRHSSSWNELPQRPPAVTPVGRGMGVIATARAIRDHTSLLIVESVAGRSARRCGTVLRQHYSTNAAAWLSQSGGAVPFPCGCVHTPARPSCKEQQPRMWTRTLATLTSLGMTLGGCAAGEAPPPSGPVVIGVLVDSADGEGAGADAVRGAELAVELVNTSHSEVPLPLAAGAGLPGLVGGQLRPAAHPLPIDNRQHSPGTRPGYAVDMADRTIHILYTVEQDEDGVWCAHAQLRPGVGAHGQGDTRAAAIEDLREAVTGLIEEFGVPDEIAVTVPAAA